MKSLKTPCFIRSRDNKLGPQDQSSFKYRDASQKYSFLSASRTLMRSGSRIVRVIRNYVIIFDRIYRIVNYLRILIRLRIPANNSVLSLSKPSFARACLTDTQRVFIAINGGRNQFPATVIFTALSCSGHPVTATRTSLPLCRL